jgi:oligoribonuclease NrnB/cAMP/cGMP phosphodiesterase (DHH superfamily)
MADLDGMCSGAIVKYKYPECEIFPINYGTDFDISYIEEGEPVYLVDFILEPFEVMLKLDEKSELIWIDHHETSLKEAEKNKFNPQGRRVNNTAACELTWRYLFPDTEVPFAIKLLSKYDTWNHDWSPYIIPFQYGMKTIDNNPEATIWSLLFQNNSLVPIQNLTESGRTVLKYVKREYEVYVKSNAFTIMFEGYNCLCCNRGSGGSKLFDSIWEDKEHDICLVFCRSRNNKWKITMYTPHEGVDCGKIAKKYGGGGHKVAAGFSCKTLPFEI